MDKYASNRHVVLLRGLLDKAPPKPLELVTSKQMITQKHERQRANST